MQNGVKTILYPLPKEHYDVKFQQQEQLVNTLFELLQNLQSYITLGQQDIQAKVMSISSAGTTPLGRFEKAVKVSRAKLEFMQITNDHKLAIEAFCDTKFNYENIFLPDYELKIKAALENWDKLQSDLEAYPEIKEQLKKDLMDRDWDINMDEVKLAYSNMANTLISQKKTIAV